MSAAVKNPERETGLDPLVLRCDTPGHRDVTGDWETAIAEGWDIPLWAWVSPETGGVAYYPFAARDCALIPGRDPLGLRRCPGCVKANAGAPGENGEFPAYNWAACLPAARSRMPAQKHYGGSLQDLYAILDQRGLLRADEVEELLGAAPDAAAAADDSLTAVISHEEAAAPDWEQPTALIPVPQPQDAAPDEPAAVYVPLDSPLFADDEDDEDAKARNAVIDGLFAGEQDMWGAERDAGRPHTAPMEAVGGEA